MFLHLAHTQLDIFKESRSLTLEVYRISKLFPSEEKFAMIQQMRRAVLSVHLNIAEGCSRKSSAERKRFYEISRGSLIEVDTILDIATELKYINSEQLQKPGELIISTFKQLTGLIN